MKSDFMVALKQLAAERHLPMEQVLGAIEVALASAFKKDNPASGQNITVTLNPNSGEVSVYALKTVVETVADPEREITVHDAKRIKKTAALGDEVAAAEPLPHNASRIAAPRNSKSERKSEPAAKTTNSLSSNRGSLTANWNFPPAFSTANWTSSAASSTKPEAAAPSACAHRSSTTSSSANSAIH